MVVGEAKSGKSTFINAYLGEEILPMDVKQCTSSIVEIRYGEKFILKATYADDRTKTLTDEQKIKEFLTRNAAMNDEYRDIPVAVINMEILMHKKDKKILEADIADLMKGIKDENLYHLSDKEYENKVRQYIKAKQPVWRDIVKKIEIEYPFDDKELRNIEIIDTPGVNADGRVGDITDQYIEDANAVMFLKPITGAALEATSFKKFLNSKSADRNKNAMFLLLTRAANETPDNISRIQEEALRQFPVINPKQIIPVDSKAELFYNKVKHLTAEELKGYLSQLRKARQLDGFIKGAWFDADGDREEFLKVLKELSRFNDIDDALNQFAHKAQYILFGDFLGRMDAVMTTITDQLDETRGFYKEKAEDPIELGNRINELKRDLEGITLKINRTVDDVVDKYAGTNGIIDQRADVVIKEYKREIAALDPDGDSSLDELEKISFRKIDIFKQYEEKLQKNIVAECDQALIALSDKSAIKYTTIKPDLTKESFEKIKEDLKNSDEAQESYSYTTGTTFTETHYASRFSRKKYYKLVKKSISSRIDKIKKEAVTDLKRFTGKVTNEYSKELAKNAKIKRDELNEIVQKRQSAEEIQAKIRELSVLLNDFQPMLERVKKMKGGIDKNVG